ncbi:MAG: translocation/assembly module TamB domain-containing protein [Kofleriaceae bacterium]|nr:translocation/assembly module TamB domain-containing protein [Kofleriaceae bacterium]
MSRPRRPLWRRILRGLAITLVSLVVLVLLALGFLQTSWGKNIVRGRIEARLAAMVNGKVSLGSVDYSFLFHDIQLGDLRIEDAQGTPTLGLASLRVALDRGSLIEGKPVIEQLAVAGLDVSLVKSAGGGSNLKGLFKPSNRKPLASIRVDQITVSGSATIINPNGTTIAVRDLKLAGSLAARPVAKELDVVLRDLGAIATITPKGGQAREVVVSVGSITAGRRLDAVDLDMQKVAAGALGIDALGAHLKLDGGALAGHQDIKLSGVTLDDTKLEQLLGRELLAEDSTAEITIAGPPQALVVDGTVTSGGAKPGLEGTLDLSTPERPRYRVSLTGAGLRSDLVVTTKERPLVESSLAVHVEGEGAARGDIDATIGIAVGPTKVGKLSVSGLFVSATAHQGALSLSMLQATAPGVAIDARGTLAADMQVSGAIAVRGTPAEVVATLAAAGIELPTKVPLPPTLDLTLHATGNLEGELAVRLDPTRVKVAGGEVSIAGNATLNAKKLAHATTDVTLRGLDLASLARLAGKRPTITGSVSGTLELERTATSKSAAFHLALALDKLGLAIDARGTATEVGAVATLTAMRKRDRVVVATVKAAVPLTKRNGKLALHTTGKLDVDIDVAKQSLGELAELLPARLRSTLPPGAVEAHIDLGGTAARPTGTIDVALTARKLKSEQQRVQLHADLTSSARGIAVATSGTVWLRDEAAPIATLAGTITTALPLANGKLDPRALRASAQVDAVITVPERELASLAFLTDTLAKLEATFDGTIAVKGPLAKPVLDANLAVHGFPTAAGTPGRATLSAQGTPTALTAKLAGAGVSITAAIDRSTKDRIAVDVAAHADHAPLLPLLPAFLAPKLAGHETGALDWNMTGKLVLVHGERGLLLETAAITGTLDVKGGVFAVPKSTRRWHDIALSIASEPTGLRINSLAVHESDRQVADRKVEVSGFVSLAKLTPQKVTLTLSGENWLLSGTPLLGMHDAPRATANFDIGVEVDLMAPVLAVDATVKQFELRIPDRHDRAHAVEVASVSGDIMYLDSPNVRTGKLPVVVRSAAPTAPRKRRPMDIRVRIPAPIRVEQAPIDVMAEGELAIQIRDEGTMLRGGLAVTGGQLSIMGREYKVVDGSLVYDDAHPKGTLAVTFERPLPPPVMRQLSLESAGGGAKFILSGSPSNMANLGKAFGGASNAGLQDAMSINGRGYPLYISAPDLPASTTVVAPRGDGLGVISFMAQNLPHLLVLDRADAHSDQYRGAAVYGRIENAEVERYSDDQKARIRGVVRPLTPGRSSAEVQVDRMLINSDRTAVGVGVRAGDRVGGGVGVFVEWSSDD